MADMSDQVINQFNLRMRQQPWYQDFFRRRGLDPNRVRLNDRQQGELERVMVANGVPLVKGTHIDPAGNLNTTHGWAGLPTWAKVAIIAGATVATAGAAGAFTGPAAGTIGAAGSGAGAGAAGAGAAGTIGALAVPTAAAVAPAAVAGGIGWGGVLSASLGPAVGTIGSIYANRAAAGGARSAADAQISSANYAADLESKAAADQLAFLREQEAQRRKEFEATEAKNLALHNEETGYTRGLDTRRYNDLAPYRNFGIGSLGQLARPIKNIRQGRA